VLTSVTTRPAVGRRDQRSCRGTRPCLATPRRRSCGPLTQPLLPSRHVSTSMSSSMYAAIASPISTTRHTVHTRQSTREGIVCGHRQCRLRRAVAPEPTSISPLPLRRTDGIGHQLLGPASNRCGFRVKSRSGEVRPGRRIEPAVAARRGRTCSGLSSTRRPFRLCASETDRQLVPIAEAAEPRSPLVQDATSR
jgi:hypothetical protein